MFSIFFFFRVSGRFREKIRLPFFSLTICSFIYLFIISFLNARLPGSSVNAINLLIRRKKESYTFWAACLAVLLKENTAEERILYYLQILNDRLTKKQQQQQQ